MTFEDGLGQRSRAADAAGGAGLEVLTLRSSFSTVSSFEFALRERVGRLATFRHAYYARVRSVDRTAGVDPHLRVISEGGEGLRLSHLLAGAQARRVPMDINAALCVIRQLVPAVAMLHESARDVAHGAIAPERLIVSSQARLLIVEYVLGAALEQLRYTRERYWTELRIPLPPGGLSPRFDHRCDVTQIGVVALSLILGRPLKTEEFPDRIADVVASTWAVSPRGGFEPLPPGLRGWLARALQLDASRSFRSAIDARAELDTVLGDSELVAAPASLEAFLARYHASDAPPMEVQTTGRSADVDAPVRAAQRDEQRSDVRNANPVDAASIATKEASSTPLAFASLDHRLATPPALDTVDDRKTLASTVPSEPLSPIAESSSAAPVTRISDPPFTFAATGAGEYRRYTDDEPSPDGSGQWWKNWRVLGAAVAVVAVIGVGSSIGARRPAAEPEVLAASGTLEVSSNPAGVQAYIDGQLRGTTPLVLALEPGSHNLELRGSGEPRSIPITVSPGARVSQYVELPASGASRAPADVRPADPPPVTSDKPAVSAPTVPSVPAGTVSLTSPIALQVFENGSSIGNSRDRLALAPGRHDLELVNAELGIRIVQPVEIASGRMSTVTPAIPNGTISLNAVPWAEVWLDGEKVGETPIGNMSVRVGSHDVLFRHPELGERHQTIVVTAKEPARLSVTMQGR